MHRWLTNQRGFTLAELLVVTAVTGLVMAGVFVLQKEGQEAYLFGSSRVETQQNARVALSLMTRELHTANPTPTAPTGIVSIPSATNITFLDQCGNSVQYSLVGTTLNRTGTTYANRDLCLPNGSGTTPLIGGVQTLTMTYYSVYDVYNNTYTTTTNATVVKVIKIRIVTKTELGATAGSASEGSATMESTLKLRATLS